MDVTQEDKNAAYKRKDKIIQKVEMNFGRRFKFLLDTNEIAAGGGGSLCQKRWGGVC